MKNSRLRIFGSWLLSLLMLPAFHVGAADESHDRTNLALGKPVTVQTDVPNASSYAELDRFVPELLTDGEYGPAKFSAPQWNKFYRAVGRTLTVDLGTLCTVDGIYTRFLQNCAAGIVCPRTVSVYVSQDGVNFAEVKAPSGGIAPFQPYEGNTDMIAEYDISFEPASARYVALHFDVTVNSFVDEIEIYGYSGSDLEPLTDYTDIVPASLDSFCDREALGGDCDIICFHAGYSPDEPRYANNTKEFFMPYIGYVDSVGTVVDTMFDSVMFLIFQGKCPSGGSLTINGDPTDINDWIMLLDNYFAEDYNLHALDQATAELKSSLSLPEDHKTSVYLTVPYPKISNKDFGDFDSDGVPEKISTYQDCLDVSVWFLEQVQMRWESAGFENIDLKGYFFNSEALTGQYYEYEDRYAADMTKLLHERGLYCVMIPYYQATGIDRIQEIGFDAALMQPNLSFNESLQDDPEGMMDDFSMTASQLGLGIQMELNSSLRWEPDKYGPLYMQYLASASLSGLMTDTIHAYYNGAGPGSFYDCANGTGQNRFYYDVTYKFIKGTLKLPETFAVGELNTSLEAVTGGRVVGECGAVGDWYYTYELTKMPTGGNVRFLDNGTFVYTAGRKFVGEDSFSYDILLNGELIGSNDVTVVVSAAQEDESVADVTSVTAESEVPSNEGKIKWYVISAVILLGLVGIAVYFMVKRAGGK